MDTNGNGLSGFYISEAAGSDGASGVAKRYQDGSPRNLVATSSFSGDTSLASCRHQVVELRASVYCSDVLECDGVVGAYGEFSNAARLFSCD